MAAALPSFERATQGAKSSEALNFLRRSPTKLLIGGKWVSPKSGKTINPANEEVLALVAEGDKAEVDFDAQRRLVAGGDRKARRHRRSMRRESKF